MRYNKKQLVKIISAIVISDGHLTNKKTANLSFTQIESHKDFYDVIKDYVSPLTRVRETVRIYENQNHNNLLRLDTLSHPIYTELRNRFYIDGKKVVDPHAMTLLDAEFLAIWYMADGTYHYRKSNSSHVLNLCTDSFSYGDHLIMQKALYEKLNLNFRIHKRKNTYRLYLPVKEYTKFIEIVSPYIVDSFKYKIPSYVESERKAPVEQGDEIV